MTAKDFPVTTPYGWVTGYPLNVNSDGEHPGQGFHKGIDYGCPDSTAIVVNGVQIGISGHTGEVTGPHTHIGKWVNGAVQDPGVGNGWQLSNPHVTDIDYDDTNGYYVGLLDASGVRWVYLHMQEKSTNVKVGDYLDQLPKYEEQDMAQVDELEAQVKQLQENYDLAHSQAVAANQRADGLQAELEGERKGYEAQIADLQKELADAQSGKPNAGTVLAPGTYTVKE